MMSEFDYISKMLSIYHKDNVPSKETKTMVQKFSMIFNES